MKEGYYQEPGLCVHCNKRQRTRVPRMDYYYPTCYRCTTEGHQHKYLTDYIPKQYLCEYCGKNPQRPNTTKGKTYYDRLCNVCYLQLQRLGFLVKKERCAHCGIDTLENYDIDHIDGNSQNNTPENIQVLCRTCHIKKTKRCCDHIGTKPGNRR